MQEHDAIRIAQVEGFTYQPSIYRIGPPEPGFSSADLVSLVPREPALGATWLTSSPGGEASGKKFGVATRRTLNLRAERRIRSPIIKTKTNHILQSSCIITLVICDSCCLNAMDSV